MLGHRGASARRAREHASRAFERARADGADGVELDVLCCAHRRGGGVSRRRSVAPGAAAPSASTAMPLRRVARGASCRAVTRIPTLEEAFEAVRARTCWSTSSSRRTACATVGVPALVERVADILERMGDRRRACWCRRSTRWRSWLWMRRAPAVQAGLLFEAEPPLPLRRAWAAPCCARRRCTPGVVLCRPDASPAGGGAATRANTWTVDDAGVLRGVPRHGHSTA